MKQMTMVMEMKEMHYYYFLIRTLLQETQIYIYIDNDINVHDSLKSQLSTLVVAY